MKNWNEIFGQPHVLKSMRTHAHLKGRIAKLKLWRRSLIKLVQSSALRSRKSMFLGENLNSWYAWRWHRPNGRDESTLPTQVFLPFPISLHLLLEYAWLVELCTLPSSPSGPPSFPAGPPQPCRHSACGPFRPITRIPGSMHSLQDIGNPSHWYSAPQHGPCSIVFWPREHRCSSAATESWEGL